MSPSAKSLAIALGATCALMAAAWLLRAQKPIQTNPKISIHDSTESNAIDVRASRLSTRNATARPRKAKLSSPREVTTGVKVLPVMQTINPLPPLSGYVVDSFESWTTIPDGYRYHGITIRNGAITLSGDPASTAPRFGQLRSPALPLKAPALAGPVRNPRPLPENAIVNAEISLSESGEEWSPWTALEKYRPVDGKRVTPPLQATISESELESPDTRTSVSSTPPAGPSIRYRISISSSGGPAPSITDIRIWKREQ